MAKSQLVGVRLNADEQEAMTALLNAWERDGLANTPAEVLRRCLMLANNHRLRSNRKPQKVWDVSGDNRCGRPAGASVNDSAITVGTEVDGD